MSTVSQSNFITPEEYLAIERAAEIKSEYFRGEMFAMSGASRAHNLIANNSSRELGNQLLERPCEVYQSDMRVKVSSTGLYTYPDFVVVCSQPVFEDVHVDTLVNPTMLIEVLSESTADYDRGRKFEHYRRIESLREYLLVAQDTMHIERFTRQPDSRWVLWETDDPESVVDLESIGCRLKASALYYKVELTPQT